MGRALKKFERLGYISLMAFPGTKGSVIYLQNYLSTMFQISDVLIDKEEVAMSLNIKISLPDKDGDNAVEENGALEPEVCVSEGLSSVSKSHMEALVRKVAEILDS